MQSAHLTRSVAVAFDFRVASAWRRVNKARRLYQRRKTPLHQHALNIARRRYKKIKNIVKLQHHTSYSNKMKSGRMDLLFETRRAHLRPLSTRDGGALLTDVAVAFWRQQFSSPTDEAISTKAPLATDMSEITSSRRWPPSPSSTRRRARPALMA